MATSVTCKAVVEHEYTAATPEELTLREGEILLIEFKSDETGWWVGENIQTGEAGIFPGEFVTIFEEELDLPDYEQSLQLLADELEKFEGEDSQDGDALLHGVLAEIQLNTSLAIKGGFCSFDGLKDPKVFLFFTAEVLAGIAVRSLELDETEGLSLINGVVVPGMISAGVATSVSKLMVEAKNILATLPIENPTVSELLQSSFAREVSVEEISDVVGSEHLGAFKLCTETITSAATALSEDKDFMKQYKTAVSAKKPNNAPQTKTELVTSLAINLKDKIFVGARGLTSKAMQLATKAKTIASTNAQKASEKASPHIKSALSTAYTTSLIATMKMKTFARTVGQKVDIEKLKLKALAMKKFVKAPPPARPPPPVTK